MWDGEGGEWGVIGWLARKTLMNSRRGNELAAVIDDGEHSCDDDNFCTEHL